MVLGALRQAMRAAATGAAALLLLASCAYAPVAVEGLQPPEIGADRGDSPWIFVPVGMWLTRDTIVPRAVGMCELPSCPTKVAVAVFEARGAEARALQRTLRNPSELARMLVAGNQTRRRLVAESNRSVPAAIAARRMPRRVAASAVRLRHRGFSGFTLTIRRVEGQARTAHGAVLARPQGNRIRVVVVVGERPGTVDTAVKAAADANL
ncbi:hypothetical protein [Phreatobacter sp. AB_2022a]|uniref:hypothetical protein n=1 Tax=Phreatobacter sp. AB_2022a TaxID=3003134 RepID=UPI00228700A5|nr:hypothetical protein [Phreatobacter sp. AB_2022a]MCZ0736670.1 hypothetical protein [Phreatobacter sp. AB_2022a]